MYYGVFVASQRFHGNDVLSYSSDSRLVPGQIVQVPLQGKKVLAVVKSQTDKPGFTTKEILFAWPLVLPQSSFDLLQWLRGYYPAPLGLLTELFTPPALSKKLPAGTDSNLSGEIAASHLPPLTSEQQRVMKFLTNSEEKSALIHGDTATGKTRLYLELTKTAIQNGKSAIVLTPEIGLTEPLVDEFRAVFGKRILLTHSHMTPAQRRNIWIQAVNAKDGLVVIGPRSALFTPLDNIGLIVMDEAHDSAYKQEQAPRYQTSRVAARLAQIHNARFVMGSATPLIADYFAFQTKQLPIVRMTKPATAGSQKVTTTLVDLRHKEHFNKSPWLADTLVEAMSEALKKGEQSLLFLNRRGSARLVLCDNCGWQGMCPHCDTALTYHHDTYLMRCHSCNFSGRVPSSCPVCKAPELIFRSIGTKSLETEVHRLFHGIRIGRFDRDTDKAARLSQQYQDLKTGAVDVVIGTQSVVKGFDLPKLSVVGVVQADSSLQIPDYTANERTFQLLSQVSGRIGRGHRTGQLFVQTYQPESTLIESALQKNYQDFYEQELKQRQQYNFPPYVHLMKITVARASTAAAFKACLALAQRLKDTKGIAVEGPSPRFVEKVSGRYGWHIVVKAKKRSALLGVVEQLGSGFIYDIEPADLL